MDEETNKFVVNQEAIDYLNSLHGKIAVVSIAGIYRTGKSYLLNKLMDAPKGFQVGPTVRACTKGIWIWGKALEGEESDEHVLFLDTEGLGSTNRSETYDCRVFALALLLSSYFIYNSFGTIDGSAIQRLSLVVNLTKYIHVKARQSEEDDGREYSQFFPHFLWVVRDFSVKLEQNGKRISARQYLEEALRPEDSTSESAEQKNEIRNLLRNFFPERDCLTMVRPMNDEKQLAKLAEQPDEELRPEFRKQMDALKQRVFKTVRPKTLYGQPLNGAMLANLAQQYVSALNDNKTPTISTAWDRVIQSQCAEALDASLRKYRDEMTEKMKSKNGEYIVHEEDNLRKIHASASIAARNIFQKNSVRDPERVAHFESQLFEKVEEEFLKFAEKNFEASSKHCESLLQTLVPGHKQKADKRIQDQGEETVLPFPTVSTIYQQAAKDLQQDYLEKAVGPAKHCILSYGLVSRLPTEWLQQWAQYASDLSNEAFKTVQRKTESMETELTTTQGKLKSLQERAEHEKQSYESSLESLKRQSALEKETLQQQVDDKSAEVDRMSNKYDRLAESHKLANDHIVQQLDEAKYQREDITSQLKYLCDDLAKKVEEKLNLGEKVVQLQEESAQLQQKLAQERQNQTELNSQIEIAKEQRKSAETETVRLREETELLYESLSNQKELLASRTDEKEEAEYQWGAVKAKLAQMESDKLRLEEDVATLESLGATMKHELKRLKKLDGLKLDSAEKKRLQDL